VKGTIVQVGLEDGRKHAGTKRLSSLRGVRRSSGAVARDVTFLAAIVTGFRCRLRTVPGDVADSVAVIALRSLSAVARQVASTSASVASLSSSTSPSSVASSTSAATAGLWAGAGDVSDLSTLVAFLTTASTAAASTSATARTPVLASASASAPSRSRGVVVGAVSRDMPCFAALVAGLRLGFLGAFPRTVASPAAIVACWIAPTRALGSEMAG